MGKRCVYINPKTNEQCKRYKQKDSLFCFTHDPDKKQAKALAVSQGGRSRAFLTKLSPMKIESMKDVAEAITKTLNEVRKGNLEPQRANTFFYGCNALMKAFDLTRGLTSKSNHLLNMTEEEIMKELSALKGKEDK